MNQRPGIPLGRWFGVPVFLAPSWFVIAIVVVLVFSPQVEGALGLGPPGSWLVAGLYAVLLLVSVLVHEFAHALAARAYRMPVHEVVATLWGGHTQFEDVAPTPLRNAVISVVGPVANAGLAVAGLLALQVFDSGVARLLTVALIFSNTFVAVFNLAPGLPLDGGRVVESIVWAVSGSRTAGTLVAGWSGRVVAALVVLWGIGLPLLRAQTPSLFTLVWSVMIAALLWQGASAAIAVAHLRRRAVGLSLVAYTEPAVALAVDSADWQLRTANSSTHVVAVDTPRSPVGLLRAADAEQLATGNVPVGTPLSAVMTVLEPGAVLPATATGEDVLQALATAPAQTYVVVDPAGRVIGIADGERLAAAVTGERARRSAWTRRP